MTAHQIGSDTYYIYWIEIELLNPLDYDGNQFQLSLPKVEYEITLSSRGSKISDSNKLRLTGQRFATEADARTAMERMKNVLSFAILFSYSPIKIGNSKVKRHAMFSAEFMVSSNLTVLASRDLFVNALRDADELFKDSPNEKFSIALELYFQSKFDGSPRASYLTLISVVETLTPDIEQPEDIKILIDELLSYFKKNFRGNAKLKESLEGRLRQLKTDSIGRSTAGLIEDYLGSEKAEWFKNCYNIRSMIVHGSATKETNKKMGQLHPELDTFVAQLLKAIYERQLV